jgi:folate-binding protein YgfZ
LKPRDPVLESVVVSPVLSRVLVAGGRDRLRLLHAVTTQDVASLAPGEGAYGALVDDRGHPLSDFNLVVLPEAVLIELPRARAERVRAALERVIIADDVTLAWARGTAIAYESADAERLSAVFGERRRAAGRFAPPTSALEDVGPGVGYDAAAGQPEEDLDEDALADLPLARGAVIRASRLGGYGALHLSEAGMDEVAAAAGAGAVPLLSAVDLDPLEIAAGRAGDPELSEAKVWNELGLMNAVNFTKGCFMGQEILNRVLSQGAVQRRLTGLVLDVPHGTGWAGALLETADGKPAGVITRAARHAALGQTIAFAFVRRASWAPGTELVARAAGDASGARAVVAPLPFVHYGPAAAAPPYLPVEVR